MVRASSSTTFASATQKLKLCCRYSKATLLSLHWPALVATCCRSRCRSSQQPQSRLLPHRRTTPANHSSATLSPIEAPTPPPRSALTPASTQTATHQAAESSPPPVWAPTSPRHELTPTSGWHRSASRTCRSGATLRGGHPEHNSPRTPLRVSTSTRALVLSAK